MRPDMPRPLPPYVQIHRRASGEVVYYFRRDRGHRIRLPAPTAPDFEAAYTACLAGSAERKPPAPSKAPKGTLRWLVEQWQRSGDWAQSAPATRKQRENILVEVLERIGGDPFAGITAADILAGRDRRSDRPFAADNFLKTMRALFRWAIAAGELQDNPAAAVKMFKAKTEGFPAWTEDDVARYRKRWPMGTRQRLALELLRYTGLRRGDAVRLGRQHIQDGVAILKAEKTGVELFVPILPELTEAIAACPTGDLAFIVDESGRPLTKEGFGNLFRDWCRAAKVNASAHGLRKLAATTVAEAGASEMQLQALFGWTTNSQSAVYTRGARRKALAIEAAQRLRRRG